MSLKPYHVPFYRRIVRALMRSIFRLIFRILAPVRIVGKENIPRHQPYIAAINHVSLFDPPFVLAFWPEAPEAMGAVDIWNRPGQNVLVRLYGGIPVHRGEYDRRLMDTVLSALRAGRPVLIAPEGERSHAPGMQRAKPGIAFILDETRVPVVPAGIIGTTDDFWHRASRGQRPKLEMRIGKPFLLPALDGKGALRRDSRQRNADLVMSHIASLLPEEYRGVYANTSIPSAKTSQ